MEDGKEIRSHIDSQNKKDIYSKKWKENKFEEGNLEEGTRHIIGGIWRRSAKSDFQFGPRKGLGTWLASYFVFPPIFYLFCK